MTPAQSPPVYGLSHSPFFKAIDMTYKITNAAAVSALAVMRGINKDVATVQEQVASNLRIETAADNASYWSFATVMRSDSGSLKSINDALGLGAAKVDTTYTSMSSLTDLVTKIRTTLVSAQSAGVDKDLVNTTLTQLKEQLQTVVQGTSFASDNWLMNSDPTVPAARSVIGGFVRGTNGEYIPQTIDFPGSQTVMIDTLDASRGLLTKTVDANAIKPDGTSTPRNYFLVNAGSTTPATGTEISISSSTTNAQLDDMLNVVDSILSSLTTTSAGLGLMNERIENRSDFVSDLTDSLDKSVGDLVDTDMEEASSRQTALLTQQQMATQAMSILNTAASKVLILLQ
jgi:flagellin